MSKSHVAKEMHFCPVCGQTHAVGILLDRRLKDSLEPETVTGCSLCPEHAKLDQDGYIALVVTTDVPEDGEKLPLSANRTGDIAHIRRKILSQMFTLPAETVASPLIYISLENFAWLKELYNGAVHAGTAEGE